MSFQYCVEVGHGDIVIVKQLTLVVADEEVLAGQAHEDEGDPEPDRGPAPRLVSHPGYFRDQKMRREGGSRDKVCQQLYL